LLIFLNHNKSQVEYKNNDRLYWLAASILLKVCGAVLITFSFEFANLPTNEKQSRVAEKSADQWEARKY
jgi:hypothetical protein